MNARGLLRLYPRAWRDRYGDEFLALLDDRALGITEIADIALGALDARLTSSTRMAAMEASGGSMKVLSKVCARPAEAEVSRSVALISAGLMIGMSLLMSVAGTLVRRSGWPDTGQFLLAMAFPAALMVSLPMLYLRHHSWRVHLAIVGGTLAFLSLITLLAMRI
jgi:hypothetical protein